MGFWVLDGSVGVREGFFLLLLSAKGRVGLVTLFVLGPKARVCWARAVEVVGLRRVGGMFVGWILGAGKRLLGLVYGEGFQQLDRYDVR